MHKVTTLLTALLLSLPFFGCDSDSPTGSDNSTQSSGLNGTWIITNSIIVEHVKPDTPTDTILYSLDGGGDSISTSVVQITDETFTYYTHNQGTVSAAIMQVTDSSIISDLGPIEYSLNGATFTMFTRATITNSSTDYETGVTTTDTASHKVIYDNYSRYSGAVPPIEWK